MSFWPFDHFTIYCNILIKCRKTSEHPFCPKDHNRLLCFQSLIVNCSNYIHLNLTFNTDMILHKWIILLNIYLNIYPLTDPFFKNLCWSLTKTYYTENHFSTRMIWWVHGNWIKPKPLLCGWRILFMCILSDNIKIQKMAIICE